ncbi:hypothetical protein ACWC2T_04770 [Streptomyces sp. NPDC001393]
MSEIEELRRRMDAFEAEMDALREQITTTRAVVAINDRDVAEFKTELRAHRQVLQALRETQIEQGQRLENLEAKVDRGFATVLSAVQTIADRLPDEAPGD